MYSDKFINVTESKVNVVKNPIVVETLNEKPSYRTVNVNAIVTHQQAVINPSIINVDEVKYTV